MARAAKKTTEPIPDEGLSEETLKAAAAPPETDFFPEFTAREDRPTEYYWTLAEPPEAKRIELAQPGMFSISMERAFAPRGFPLTLTERDIDTLNGMAATWAEATVSPYVLMMSNIRKYKKILVYPKYPGENNNDGDEG
jgi:hypothetical protein